MGDWRVLLAIVLLVLAAVMLVNRRRAMPSLLDRPNDLMPALASEGVQRAKVEFQMTLDYTPDSVEQLETILTVMHERRAKGEMTDARMAREAMTWGAYIGEVTQRYEGGHWTHREQVDGRYVYPSFGNDRHTMYPVDWCGKRILNGAEDNVWHKFQQFVLKRFEEWVLEGDKMLPKSELKDE
jgi:hypothetical protein